MTFITSPNQRKVTIHKCDRKKNYSKLDVEANKTAMRKLGYSAYMLYMYFCMNATAFDLILSKAALCAETSLTKNVYYSSFEKLVAEGYLVRKEGTQCLFDFYEDPSANTADPKTGSEYTQKRESPHQKQVENTKKYRNTTRGDASALPPGDENRTSTASGTHGKRRLFVDM